MYYIEQFFVGEEQKRAADVTEQVPFALLEPSSSFFSETQSRYLNVFRYQYEKIQSKSCPFFSIYDSAVHCGRLRYI